MHSDKDTDPKRNKSRQFRAHRSRNCLYLLSRVSGCELLMVNEGMGRGSS